MKRTLLLAPLAAVIVLGGCVTVPTGPTVMVLPGPQKSLDQFNGDGLTCQQYAQNVVAPAGVAAANNAAANAAVGTALGAAAGAIIGSATGQAGAGAAIGAGTGLLFSGAIDQQHGVRVVLADAARLRRRLHAMHVCARQPAARPDSRRVSSRCTVIRRPTTRRRGRAIGLSAGRLSAAQYAAAGRRGSARVEPLASTRHTATCVRWFAGV